MNVRFPVITAAAALAAAAALSACGTATSAGSGAASGPSATASSRPTTAPSSPVPTPPPTGGAPMIRAVQLDTSFSPASITLGAGQQFQVIVNPAVDASGASFPAQCAPQPAAPVNSGMLTVSCPAAGSYLFTAEQAGTTVLSVSIRPHCGPGVACPQWIKLASLTVTIT